MRIHYAARGFELTADLEKYAAGKLARLNRKIPREFRAGTGCEVTFAAATRRGVKQNTCEIILSVDAEVLIAKETTQHMHSALDIAAAQIEQQLKNYTRARRRRIFRVGS